MLNRSLPHTDERVCQNQSYTGCYPRCRNYLLYIATVKFKRGPKECRYHSFRLPTSTVSIEVRYATLLRNKMYRLKQHKFAFKTAKYSFSSPEIISRSGSNIWRCFEMESFEKYGSGINVKFREDYHGTQRRILRWFHSNRSSGHYLGSYKLIYRHFIQNV